MCFDSGLTNVSLLMLAAKHKGLPRHQLLDRLASVQDGR
jgi:hypothetical protein